MTHLVLLLICGAAPFGTWDADRDDDLLRFEGLVARYRFLDKAGRHDVAFADMGRIVAEARRIHGDHRVTATWLGGLARATAARGRRAEAATLCRDEARIWRRIGGPDGWRAVDAVWKAREMDRPFTAAQSARLAEARRASHAGLALLDKGDTVGARVLLVEALEARRALLGEAHPEYAGGLHNLAAVLEEEGRHRDALATSEKALAAFAVALGARHPHYLTCLSSHAAMLGRVGEPRAGLPLAARVLRVRREVLGTWHPACADAVNSLAVLNKEAGEMPAALRHARAAVALTAGSSGPALLDHAVHLHNLASIHRQMGDPASALPLAREALAIRKRLQGEAHPAYASALVIVATLLDVGDGAPLAQLHYERALLIREAVFGSRHPTTASSLDQLAMCLQRQGKLDAALPLSRRALAIRRDVLGDRHPDTGRGLHNLAALYKDRAEHALALPLAHRGLELQRLHSGPAHPDYALGLHNLALLYRAMGRPSAAALLSEQALDVTRRNLLSSAAVQSERQQLLALDACRNRLYLRLSLPDEPPTLAHAHALEWKGAAFALARRRRLFASLRAGTDPEAAEAAGRLPEVTRRLAALAGKGGPEAARLNEEKERLEADLAGRSAAFRAGAARLTPAALAAALPEGVALVDYLFHNKPALAGGVVKSLAAFVVRRGVPPVRLDLGEAAPVVTAAEAWRAHLLAKRAGGGEALHALVWAPLARHLAGAKVVLVSPDGPLASVPFAALPGSKEGSYLIEDVAVALVPVPRLVPEMLGTKGPRLAPSLLALGDVDFDGKGEARPAGADDRSAPRAGQRAWGRLSATRVEVNDVKDAFGRLFKGGVVADLREGAATKAAVREALGKVRYAHLATHGFFAPEAVNEGFNPLLLSGLVLSGANREPRPGEEDGILTALEVSEMDLSRLELATLSACETGLGKSAGGEGLLGLQRAFAVAGCRSVVASLWKVDDRATQQLMSEYYKAMWDPKAIISRAEALRRAQLLMLREGVKRGMVREEDVGKAARVPPYYWAAFVLSGDWR